MVDRIEWIRIVLGLLLLALFALCATDFVQRHALGRDGCMDWLRELVR